MRSQRIGRGFESLYLHHAKSTPLGVLFAWWSLNGEYAAQQGFKFNKAQKCRRSHSRQRILTRVPASGKRQNPFISIISKHLQNDSLSFCVVEFKRRVRGTVGIRISERLKVPSFAFAKANLDEGSRKRETSKSLYLHQWEPRSHPWFLFICVKGVAGIIVKTKVAEKKISYDWLTKPRQNGKFVKKTK